MKSKIIITAIILTIFSYVTSITHAQYINKVTNFFTKSKKNSRTSPKYSYINFIHPDYTSLILLPIYVLINILIITLLLATIYVLFKSLFSKNCNNEKGNYIGGDINEKQSDEIIKNEKELLNPSIINPIEKSIPLLNSLKSLSSNNGLLLEKENDQTGGEKNSTSISENSNNSSNAKNLDNPGESLITTEKSKNSNNIKTKLNEGVDNTINFFEEYIKSIKYVLWIFLLIICFQLIYFIIFLLLIRTNIINRRKLNQELYVKSIIHYYITGFYISTSLIILFIGSFYD